MTIVYAYEYLTKEIAYRYRGKIYVTILVEGGEIFGVFKPPYKQDRYLIRIYLPNWKRDRIKYHYGVQYLYQLNGKRLSGQLGVSRNGYPCLSWIKPTGKKRPISYKVKYHP